MSRLESSHLTVFSRSNNLTVLKKSIQNTLTILILMSWKHSIDFTVAFSKSLYFYSHKKCHSLPEISEKVHIKIKFHLIYLIQFIMNQNCHNSCWKQTTRLKNGTNDEVKDQNRGNYKSNAAIIISCYHYNFFQAPLSRKTDVYFQGNSCSKYFNRKLGK